MFFGREDVLDEMMALWGKRGGSLVTIGRDVIEEVDRKLAKLSTPRGKSARPVLVYEGHLAPIVEADGYFDALVPFRRLLGL